MSSAESAIIDATIDLFSKKGYAATSIRDIANEVGMTSASLYYYMNNKKDLLLLVMEKYLQQLVSGAEEAMSECINSPADQRLETLIKYHVTSHGNEKLGALVVDTEYRSLEGENKEKIKQLRNQYEQIWVDTLQEGKDELIFIFDDIKVTAYALISLCTGVAHWYRDGGRLPIEAIANQYTALGLAMVKHN